jgi:hypothetical protein
MLKNYQSHRLRWLKSIDKSLKLQAQHFWKYISNFRKDRSGSIQLVVGGAHFVEPSAVVYVFAKHFQSVYNNHCSMDIPSLWQFSEFLSFTPISNADVCKAIKRLKSSKPTGLDVFAVVIKGCSVMFVPILRHIVNLSLTPYSVEGSGYCTLI